jgi:hypothetical protein
MFGPHVEHDARFAAAAEPVAKPMQSAIVDVLSKQLIANLFPQIMVAPKQVKVDQGFATKHPRKAGELPPINDKAKRELPIL